MKKGVDALPFPIYVLHKSPFRGCEIDVKKHLREKLHLVRRSEAGGKTALLASPQSRISLGGNRVMKSALAVVTAIVMPGGFIVLGLALMTMFLARRRTAREGLAWGGNS